MLVVLFWVVPNAHSPVDISNSKIELCEKQQLSVIANLNENSAQYLLETK